MNAMLAVHLRVNDADTGRPTPVRLHLSGPTGEYYAPLGCLVDFATGRNEDVGGHVYLGGKKFAYINGTCEVRLPAEVPLTIEITKGPGYHPIRRTLALGKGQMALRFSLRRSSDPVWAEWSSADSRAHFLAPHAAQLEREAEGLDLVNLLAVVQHTPSTDGHLYPTIPNILAFSGQEPLLPGVVVNTFNTHPALGRLALLNAHRPVYPLTFGGDDADDWSLGDWCSQCHRKNGLVVWADAFRSDAGLIGGDGLVSLILGEIDAIEFDTRERTPPLLPWWYRLLNAGFRIPIVGGSGKDSNRIALGSMRTYTPPFSRYGEWIEHVRAGRTVASNGPVIRLAFDAGTRQVIARASSSVAFDRLELIVNGEVVADKGMDEAMRSEVVYEIPPGQNGWAAARCRGVAKSALYPSQAVFAHTSAIDLPFADAERSRTPTAFPGLRRSVEETRIWIERDGRFENSKSKEQLLDRCDRALKVLERNESQTRLGKDEG